MVMSWLVLAGSRADRGPVKEFSVLILVNEGPNHGTDDGLLPLSWVLNVGPFYSLHSPFLGSKL